MRLLFWFSVSLLLYTYLGYPALIALLARIRPRPVRRKPNYPTVSLVISAHNEEDNIGQKLENTLALEYPKDLVEIVLASDGSIDHTVEIARGYEKRGMKVLVFETRRGKPSVLNDVIPRCSGEIIALSDARQRYDRKALLELIQDFNDTSVGAVSGELFLENDSGAAVGDGVDFYWRHEKSIRRNESRFDSTVGATGAVYAIRRNLFEPIPSNTVLDDVLIPMRIVSRGYRVVFEPRAKAFDRAASTVPEEFARKVRTIAGNVQLFVNEPWLLSPLRNRLWFQTVSHKILRLLGPFLLAAAFGTNLLLLNDPLYRWSLGFQLSFYAVALAGHILRNAKRKMPLIGIPYVFCLLNGITVVALLRFITGRQRVTWEKASP